jgi:hypothetical protein
MPEPVAITLAEPWTYRTPLVTITYPAGEHTVTPVIAAAALMQAPAALIETEENKDGNGIAAPGAPSPADDAEG